MFSIKSKIIFAYTVAFGVVLAVFAAVIYHNARQTAIERLDARLSDYASQVEDEVAEIVDEDDGASAAKVRGEDSEVVRALKVIPSGGLSDVRIQLFNRSGTVLRPDSLFAASGLVLWRNVPPGSLTFEDLTLGRQNYRSLWRTIDTGRAFYVLQTAASMAEIDSDMHRLKLTFALLIPLALGLTGIAAFFISRAAFQPIAHIIRTARSISGSNLDARLQLPRAHDEVRMLGETLNEMIGRIDDAFKSQRRFIADAAHELRTPLTVIQTELEFAERHSGDEAISESIKIALSEIDRLNRLANSLLTLSKLDATQMPFYREPTRVDELLPECVQVIKRAIAENGVDLTLSIDEAVEIPADREKLKSVFVNLLDNAVKYSGRGGKVSVALNRSEAGALTVCISDNGPGIPEAELSLIFTRFYRSNETRSQVEGNGLGLAIAQEFTAMHGGKISVESKVGCGARFYVSLPFMPIAVSTGANFGKSL